MTDKVNSRSRFLLWMLETRVFGCCVYVSLYGFSPSEVCVAADDVVTSLVKNNILFSFILTNEFLACHITPLIYGIKQPSV